MESCTLESFLGDVKDHQVKIIRDDGVYRHVKFARPDSGILAFELVTWPGHLCYTGDMGTYVFQRLEDMFQFFRPHKLHKSWGGLGLNIEYLTEKCIAVDRQYGISEYSEEEARKEINDILDDEEISEDTRAEVEGDVLWYVYDEQALRGAIEDFKSSNGFEFKDSSDFNFHVRPYHYLWACYAISWGVLQYDEAKARIES